VSSVRASRKFAPDPEQELLLKHAELVKRIAYHLLARLPASVDVADLIQAGSIGLLEAARNYNGERGASFETYAGIRIRGAMVDELRRSDWAPRSVHRRLREISQTIHTLEQAGGQAPRDAAIAARMGLDLAEYHEAVQDAARCQVLSLDAPVDDEGHAREVADQAGSPLDTLQNEEFREALAEAIGALPEREKLVMSLYYDNQLNLREIGQVLDITESRVCQIHGQALLRLRSRLQDWRAEAAAAH
jgi:RNA polymerase sigma factor FliA